MDCADSRTGRDFSYAEGAGTTRKSRPKPALSERTGESLDGAPYESRDLK
jgi:hypothetical protein